MVDQEKVEAAIKLLLEGIGEDPTREGLLETPAPARDPGERLDLYDAIERLDWKEQTVVRLRFFEDMKLEEIARVTNTNLNTVKSRLYKSLRRLRELTEEEC